MTPVTFSAEAIENSEELNGTEQETTDSTVDDTENTNNINVEFKGWNQFGRSFGYMGMGMLGIFIVTCVLILTITTLNKIQNKPKTDKSAD